MANFRDLTEQCSKYAVPTLCYYAFPICDEMTHKPRQICKDECESLERSVCQHEFLMARQHNLMGKFTMKLLFSHHAICAGFIQLGSKCLV